MYLPFLLRLLEDLLVVGLRLVVGLHLVVELTLVVLALVMVLEQQLALVVEMQEHQQVQQYILVHNLQVVVLDLVALHLGLLLMVVLVDHPC